MHRYIESRPPCVFLIAAGGQKFSRGVQPPISRQIQPWREQERKFVLCSRKKKRKVVACGLYVCVRHTGANTAEPIEMPIGSRL